MIRAFVAVLGREVRLAFGQGNGALLVLGFFVIAACLFPFALGTDPALLARIGPAVLWAAALLATLLSLDRLFQADVEDGTLEQIAVRDLPLSLVVLAKILAHWASTGLPLVAMTPVLAILFAVPGDAMVTLMIAMAVGTPALSAIGAIGAALTAGMRRGGVLLSILVLPLYLPVLIFGAGASAAAALGQPVDQPMALLGALALASLSTAPGVAAAALRQGLE